jgi:glycosyltransferase involved in cell wall biosynthesis
MRIGIDARMFHKAGIRRYAAELTQHLSKIDQDNEYYVYLSSKRQNKFEELNSNFNVVTIEAPLFSLREQLLLVRHCKKNELDVLHTTFDFGVPLYPITKIVVTVHDAFFGPLTFFKSFKTRLVYQLLTRYSVHKSDITVVISDFVRRKVLQYIPGVRAKADKIRVVQNGVGSKFRSFHHRQEIEQMKQRYRIKGKYLFCVGSFASRNKNLLRILEAFCNLPVRLRSEYQLVIAGEFLSTVPEASRVIERLRAEDFIRCLGYVPDDDLPLLYNGAEVFIFPSLHEGFGIPVLEAMACGTPVMTSNVTAMPEIAGGAAMLIDPFNVNEMTDSMREILANESLRKDLSEKGQARAKSFSWLATARKTLDIYEEVGNRT